jgi:RNA polymerase sigma-32 factor
MGIEGQFAGFAARTRLEPTAVSDGHGSDYLYDIRRFAVLEKDHEYELAKRWREHDDRDAADRLVTSHLRLAAKIAKSYRNYGLPISEIISEGNVGLMQALNRFEPEKGFRFATYAVWWIRASIQDYILRSWSLVKIGTTANQKKLFFKLRSAKRKISALDSGGDLRPDQVTLIAKNLNVAERDVVDMNRRLAGDISLNKPIHDEGEADEWQTSLVDQSPSPEAIVAEQDETDCRREALAGAMVVLNDRERRIFGARHLIDEPLTLEDLALEFNVSRERIRQIELRAFDKVRKATRNLVADAQSAAAMLADSAASVATKSTGRILDAMVPAR